MSLFDDCSCSKIVTPSIEDLLAIRASKTPRIRIQDRKPPAAKVSAGLKGWMEWRLIDRKGREVKGGGGPNLILNQGLDQIASTALIVEQAGTSTIPTFFPIIRYCAVGTDNTTPTVNDTGLGAEVGRTGTTYTAEALTRPSDGVYEITRYVEFDFDQGNGNLTEWGFSSSSSVGSNLFNRALFLDGNGDPEVVTKTIDYKLRIIYTVQITLSPTEWTAGSFDITGVGTINGEYRLVGGPAPAGAVTSGNMRCRARDFKLWNAWAMGDMGNLATVSRIPTQGLVANWHSDLSAVTYTYNTTFNINISNAYAADAIESARDAYVSGSYQRTGGMWRWNTDYGNLAACKAFIGIGTFESYSSGLQSCGPYAGYVFKIDAADEFDKDDEHILLLGVPTVTWGRAP